REMNSHPRFFLAVVISCFSLLAASLVFTASANPTDCSTCTPPPNNGSVANAQQSAWASGTTVTVYIDPAFDQVPGGVQAIKDAFNNWANAASSGVTFQFSDQPVSGQNTYQVTKQTPSLGSSYRGETGGNTSGGHRYNAFSNINPDITDAAALTQTMAHEIGHTFGLGDAPANCAAGGSVMNSATSVNDTTSGANGPTNCDTQASAQYNGYGATPSPTPPD